MRIEVARFTRAGGFVVGQWKLAFAAPRGVGLGDSRRPPSRMVEPIEQLVQRWKRNPSPAMTVALCEALRENPLGTLVQQVGEFAKEQLASNVSVLISVARMYIESGRFLDAQAILIAAGKQSPREGNVYRWLGEVLLRRGDAARAEKVLERAIQLEAGDPDTMAWLHRARTQATAQAHGGSVAAADAGRNRHERLSGLPRFPSEIDETAPTAVFEPEVDTGEIETLMQPCPVPTATTIPKRIAAESVAASPLPAPLQPSGGSKNPPFASTSPRPSTAQRKIAPPLASTNALPAPAQPSASPKIAVPSASTNALPAAAQPSASPKIAAPFASPNAVPAAAPLSLPHPRDVLDALALAGVFEPPVGSEAKAAAWDRAPHAPKGRGIAMLVSGMALFLAASVGTYFVYRHRRAVEHVQAEALLVTVETQLRAGRPDALASIDQLLAQALRLETRSPRAALDWTRARAMTGLVKSSADVGFEDAMARAKEMGVPEEKYAFARVASFLFQGDTAGAAATLARWDSAAKGDAWYQLMAGATLERAGDPRARDRFAAASALDPELVVARVALARATAIDGDAQEAMRGSQSLRVAMPDRAEPVALVALAWGRDPRRDEAHPPAEVDAVAKRAAELPVGLKFIPPAMAALGALDKRGGAEARAGVESGLSVAESPGAAVWLGSIALSLDDEALARKAALLALQLSAAYEPARALAARVALAEGRLDEALKATEDLEPASPDVAVVRAASAYERLDGDGAARAIAALAPAGRDQPYLAALELADAAISGKLHLDGVKLTSLAEDDAPWADLVAMDVALDQGDLAAADKMATEWGKAAEAQPLRAVRLARLARYESRLEAADMLSQVALAHGTVTPRVLWERAYVLVAKGRASEVGPLLGRYPLVLGPIAAWINAYAVASNGNLEVAKAKTSSLDPPPPGAPLGARVVAASALGAMKDKRRGGDYVKDLMSLGDLQPDLVAAALALGFHRVDHGRRRPTYE